jgi:DNA-binding NtrC family response regulator
MRWRVEGPTMNCSQPNGRSCSALIVAATEGDRRLVAAAIAPSGWTSRFVADAGSARAALASGAIPVVIVDSDAKPACWRELLRTGANELASPRVIVMARGADAALWAEALNLGAYDVLAKPLDAGEVRWVVGEAWPERGSAQDGRAAD